MGFRPYAAGAAMKAPAVRQAAKKHRAADCDTVLL